MPSNIVNSIIWLLLQSAVTATILTSISSNTTLSVNNNPYQIIQDVSVSSGVTLTIENGVEIVFMGDYRLSIVGLGAINIGCDSFNSSQIQSTSAGLLDSVIFSFIHSDPLQNMQMGSIAFELGYNTYSMLCNVLFDGLHLALIGGINQPHARVVVHHSEFSSNYNAFSVLSLAQTHHPEYFIIQTSYFHNTSILSSRAKDMALYNNMITDFDEIRYMRGFLINNTIIGNGKDCLYLRSGNTTFYGNTFQNCATAVKIISEGTFVFQYNSFINNSVAIDYYCTIKYSGCYPLCTFDVIIEYNNFIDNQDNIIWSSMMSTSASNNYFGTTDILLIADSIQDICGTGSESVVYWWPFFTQPLDLSDPNSLPAYNTNTILIPSFKSVCIGVDNGHNISGNALQPAYIEDYTLSINNSPYYVIYDVSIEPNVTFAVEIGVEIIFMGDYEIIIKGKVDFGCHEIDTVSSTNIGLMNRQKAIKITNHFNDRTGSIGVRGDGHFCNVLFEGFNKIISYQTSSEDPAYRIYPTESVTFDNCEFTNMAYPYYQFVSKRFPYFNDSYFHNFESIVSGSVVFHNNIFEEFQKFDSSSWGNYNGTHSIVTNNVFDCSYSPFFSVHFHCVFEHNVIRNSPGVALSTDQAVSALPKPIKYNTFENNSIAIYCTSRCIIQYNNFIQNEINMKTYSGSRIDECNYNYFGSFNDVSNQSEVSTKIIDKCDNYGGYTFPNQYFVFWPWFITPIDFKYVEKGCSLPDMYSFNFTHCNSTYSAQSYFISSPTCTPTNHPTSTPTTNPTTSPTVDPTNSPTPSPTINPTSEPTKMPTSTPTIHPTVNPTPAPTLNPTPTPTHDPTKPPTPQCFSMKVTVRDSNGFNPDNFNGLYTITLNQQFGRPTWAVMQTPTEKTMKYIPSAWIINGIGGEILLHTSNEDFPPDNDVAAEWKHSSEPGYFHVLIECSDSYSPTAAPTPAPTNNPTPAPTMHPTPSPTYNPTPAPTNDPTFHPTYNPTPAPTTNPTTAPTPSPTRNPTPSPTSNPTHTPTSNPTPSPTTNPSRNPTNNPTFHPTKVPTSNPTQSPTLIPTITPT
eukprot:70991_1